jgi:hypothetical protein
VDGDKKGKKCDEASTLTAARNAKVLCFMMGKSRAAQFKEVRYQQAQRGIMGHDLDVVVNHACHTRLPEKGINMI